MSKAIKFKNDTYLDSGGIVHNQKVLKELLNDLSGITLYQNNGSGTAGDFTLSDNISNYKKIDINFHTNDNLFYTNTIRNPDNRSNLLISLNATKAYTGGNVYIKIREINIVGKQVTNENYAEIAIVQNGYPIIAQSNWIYIDSVVGYK